MLRFGALLTVTALACSGPSIAYSDLNQELQQARCERFARCGLFPSEASCMTFFRIPPPDASVAGAIAAHKADYDGAYAKQCVDATARQSCDGADFELEHFDVNTRSSDFEPKACGEIFTGKVAGGASCSIDAECASGTCELPDMCPPTGCCVGMCRPAQAPGKAGASCAKTRDCADGLACGTDMTCHVAGAAGAPCGSDPECGAGLGCIGASSLMPGNCRALPHAGEPCPYLRCTGENLRCDEANTHTCVALGFPGAPCAASTECSFGMECDAATNLCRELPTLGMPCDSACGGDAFCAFDSTLTMGTCVAPLPNTSPCDGYNQCASFYCEQGPIFDSCKDPYVCF